MTPLEMRFLLDCYTTPDPSCCADTEPGQGAVNEFLQAGIITLGAQPGSWDVTDKGLKFLNMILDTPYPEQAYIDPRCGAVL